MVCFVLPGGSTAIETLSGCLLLEPSDSSSTVCGRRRGDFGIARRNDAYYATVVRTISLKLPDDLLVQLDNEAKARRVTKSALIRESLEKALRKPAQGGEVSCYDLSSDLAGALKGLPEDLADNPKYMEGFGA